MAGLNALRSKVHPRAGLLHFMCPGDPEPLVEMHLLTQEVWSKAWGSAFLTGFHVMPGLLVHRLWEAQSEPTWVLLHKDFPVYSTIQGSPSSRSQRLSHSILHILPFSLIFIYVGLIFPVQFSDNFLPTFCLLTFINFYISGTVLNVNLTYFSMIR